MSEANIIKLSQSIQLLYINIRYMRYIYTRYTVSPVEEGNLNRESGYIAWIYA